MKPLFIFGILTLLPIGTSFQTGENITINQPVHDDLYIAGGTVTINAPVFGDLIVAGGNVTINDTVSNDLIVSGGTIIVDGYIGDDLRGAGGTIHLLKNVNDDVVVACSEFTMNEDATVNGNLLVVGGQLLINGNVKGEVFARGREIEFNGYADKDIDIRGEELVVNGTTIGSSIVAGKKITIGPKATFQNGLHFWNEEGTLEVGNSMIQGKPVYDESLEVESGRWELLGFTSVLLLIWYLGTALFIIFLIQFLFGKTLQSAASTVRSESLKSMGYGVLFCISLPVAVVIAFVTIIGIPLGLILLFTMITLLILATAITSLVAANWINNVYYASSWKIGKLVFAGFGIFIILKLATFTPFIGPLVMLLLVFIAFGSIIQNIHWKRKDAQIKMESGG